MALPLLEFAPRSLSGSFLDESVGDDDFIFDGLVDVYDEPPEPDHNDQLAYTGNSICLPGTPEFDLMVSKLELADLSQHASASGLSPEHVAQDRELDARISRLLVEHAQSVRYTQGGLRWEAITGNVIPWDSHGKLNGRFLLHGDCSSTSTWKGDWVVLHHHSGVKRDVFNGQAFKAGYTGTMVVRGKEVAHQSNWKVGDRLFYGRSRSDTEHVTDYMGGGVVFSHGGDAGPYFLRWNYRPDHVATRRYF